MKFKIKDIALLFSGIYSKHELPADTLYLQSVNFNEKENLNPFLKPQIKSKGKNKRYLLKKDDVLFATKGSNNFGVVHKTDFGPSVASSSFIVLRINESFTKLVDPQYLAWFLSHTNAFTQHHQKQLGTKVSFISIKKLKEVEVDITELDTQKNCKSATIAQYL